MQIICVSLIAGALNVGIGHLPGPAVPGVAKVSCDAPSIRSTATVAQPLPGGLDLRAWIEPDGSVNLQKNCAGKLSNHVALRPGMIGATPRPLYFPDCQAPGK